MEAIGDLSKSFINGLMEVEDKLEIGDWGRGEENAKRESRLNHVFQSFKGEEKTCGS